MKLWIDDIRTPNPPEVWIIARNYREATCILECFEPGLISEISFDHDLGLDSKSGYDIVCWIEEKIVTGEWTFVPKMVVHSANPVGRANIERAIRAIEDRREM
jgi:hypothetical protein